MNMDKKTTEALQNVCDHYLDDEKKDFYGGDVNDVEHIFLSLKVLNEHLETSKTEQLSECHYCGESDFEVEESENKKYVICLCCGMKGPPKLNEEDAMLAHNNSIILKT